MFPGPFDPAAHWFLQAVAMAGASIAIGLFAGIPFAIVLLLTDRDALAAGPTLRPAAGRAGGRLRSTPLLVLLLAAIPFAERAFAGAGGAFAYLAPFVLAVTAYSTHVAEIALRRVDPGLVDAGLAAGASRWQILRHYVLPEAAPGILARLSVAFLTLLGVSLIVLGSTALASGSRTAGEESFPCAPVVNTVAAVIALAYLLQASIGRLAGRTGPED